MHSGASEINRLSENFRTYFLFLLIYIFFSFSIQKIFKHKTKLKPPLIAAEISRGLHNAMPSSAPDNREGPLEQKERWSGRIIFSSRESMNLRGASFVPLKSGGNLNEENRVSAMRSRNFSEAECFCQLELSRFRSNMGLPSHRFKNLVKRES